MSGKIKAGTGRKYAYSTDRIIRKAVSLGRKYAVSTTKGKTGKQYVVNIDATQQGNVKDLLGEILQFISIIQNLFQSASKKDSEKGNEIHFGESSNGPDSPVINITFVFNFNNFGGKTE